MNSRKPVDIAVVGGGIVGLATALALTDKPGLSVQVLEKEERLAAHQTGNNSGVIHSGLYYAPGSLKARNCVAGRERLYRFCGEHGIFHERCGKVVVATRPEEIPALDELERRGRANGLEGLRRISPGEIREIEPAVEGIDGLHVRETGIVDYCEVARAFARIIEERGGSIQTGAKVLGVHRRSEGLVIESVSGEIRARNLVACCGLQADRMARRCAVDPGLRIVPFRGEYYELADTWARNVRHLVYPVPDPAFPFLGVHYTRKITGGVEAGPNAVLAFKREGYGKASFSLPDVLSMASYPAFWRMGLKYWRMGAGEFHRSYSRKAFVRALRRLTPDLPSDALVPGGAGVRAQALEAGGRLVDDFRIVEAPNMIHVLNAPSPAATASLSIGSTIAGEARTLFQ